MVKETKSTNIYEKLLEFQSKWITFEKTADNPFFKSKYTPLDDLNAKIKPILSELWLVIMHATNQSTVTTYVINANNPVEVIESSIHITDWIVDPQKIWSFITYAKRYNTVALLNLDSETDNDWNWLKSEVKPKPKFTDKVLENIQKSVIEWKYEIFDLKAMIHDISMKYTLTDKDLQAIETFYNSYVK